MAYVLGEQYKQRVDRALNAVENAAQSEGRITIQTRFEGDDAGPQKKVFRVCTFTGAWSKTTEKMVTFRGVTSTPNTVTAVNLFADIGTATSSARNCAIAKDGTAWYLIAAEC